MPFQRAKSFLCYQCARGLLKNPIDIHIQLILTIHQCAILSHFASEETEAQNDLFNL